MADMMVDAKTDETVQVGIGPLRAILDESVAGGLDSLRTHDRIAGLQTPLGAEVAPADDQTFVLLFEEHA